MKKNKIGDMEGVVHKEPKSKLVAKNGFVATNLQIKVTRRSNRKRIIKYNATRFC